MEEAKTAAEQTKDERSVRFPVQKAARRTLVPFVLYAVKNAFAIYAVQRIQRI